MGWQRVGRAALGVSVAVMAVGVPAGTAGAAKGHVYVTTNAEAGNAVLVFNRDAKGRLYRGNTYLTGGKGAPGNPDLPLQIVDSQNPVALTPDGKVLFVVNIGSDTITSFQVRGNRLRRIATAPSGGVAPNGVDARNGILYVTNAQSATMAGYRYDRLGN